MGLNLFDEEIEENVIKRKDDGKPVNDEYDNIPQHLFLVEFFVYKITSRRLAKLNQMFCIPTSVTFSFLNVDHEDAEIVQNEVNPEISKLTYEDSEPINSGRSILFPISKDVFIDKQEKFIVNLMVSKKRKGFSTVVAGSGVLDLTNQFYCLRKEAIEYSHKGLPPPQKFEGSVSLLYGEDYSGHIDLYISIETLGEAVITEFENLLNKSPSTYVFKSDLNSQNKVYECHEFDPYEDTSSYATAILDPADDVNPVQPISDKCLPCVQQDKMLKDCEPLSMTLSKVEQGSPLVLKLSGVLDPNEKGGTKVQVADGSEAISPEAAQEHDVFVLRIGKKGVVGPGEKSDIQLELKTPRGPERRPPIRYETRDVQTDEEEKKKKGKGKGKGKKKGGKKKK